jgi:NAD-dependent SIR2 family protein deacetylase
MAASRPLPAPEGGGGRAETGKEAHVAMYEAYCVKCRAKREFEGSVVELKNGRKAAQGTCPVCGTKVMRILGKSAT